MSSPDVSSRTAHLTLFTQQRRLRHLRGLSARNIVVESGRRDQLMQTYFTLQLINDTTVFYTSEKIKDSLNPTWRSFNLSNLSSLSGLDTSSTGLLVRVWGGEKPMSEEEQGDSDADKWKLIIEWKVDLRTLVCVGKSDQNEGIRYHGNTLIFGIADSYYTTSNSFDDVGGTVKGQSSSVAVGHGTVRMSYTRFSLARVSTTQRAIKQTKNTVNKVRADIEQQLARGRRNNSKLADLESLQLNVSLLRRELKEQTLTLNKERDSQIKIRQQVNQNARDLIMRREKLRKDSEIYTENKNIYIQQREELLKSSAQLMIRRRQLISELSHIYPIKELPNHTHVVCGVKLPDAENYGKEESSIASALGYTCHLMQMIAQFLQLPLTYPMINRGSRSLIKDNITKNLADKDRDFPLYSKGKEKFQFHYAVFMLNKNISQLRYRCGLATHDLRSTLPNLKTLLEMKWGIKQQPLAVGELVNAGVATRPSLAEEASEVASNSQSDHSSVVGGARPLPTGENASNSSQDQDSPENVKRKLQQLNEQQQETEQQLNRNALLDSTNNETNNESSMNDIADRTDALAREGLRYNSFKVHSNAGP